MTSKTAEEVEINEITKFRKEYEIAFTHAQQETYNLLVKWEIFWGLFEDQERVELLNKSDGLFWNTIQNSLRTDIIMSFCRLTEKSNNRQNISLDYFLELENEEKDRSELQSLRDTAYNKTELYRKVRNSYTAHRASKLVIAKSVKNGIGNKKDGFDAIRSINSALNWIQKKHFNRTTHLISLGTRPAGNVLQVLFRGTKAIEQENEDWRAGKISKKIRDHPNWLFPKDNFDGLLK